MSNDLLCLVTARLGGDQRAGRDRGALYTAQSHRPAQTNNCHTAMAGQQKSHIVKQILLRVRLVCGICGGQSKLCCVNTVGIIGGLVSINVHTPTSTSPCSDILCFRS